METSTVGLCYALHQYQMSEWWTRAIRALQDFPIEWANVPVADLQGNGATFYGHLYDDWDTFADSSKPPFAKTRDQWRAFCGGQKIKIATLFVQVPHAVDQRELNNFAIRFDPLCDLDVYVGGSWINLLDASGAANVADNWNVVRWLAPLNPTMTLRPTGKMQSFR